MLLSVCDDLSVLGTIYFIKNLIRVICIIVPVVLLLMLTLDLYQGVIVGNEEKLQKVKNVFVKRIIYAIVIFFIPNIVNGFMGLLDSNNVNNYLSCYKEADGNRINQLAEQAKIEEEQRKQEQAKAKKELETEVRKQQQQRLEAIEEAKNNATSDSSNSSNNSSTSSQASNSVSNATTYKSIKIIGTIKKKDAKKVITEKPAKKAWIGQSFTVAGNNYVTARVNSANTVATITIYNKHTNKMIKSVTRNNTFKHANGMAYNSSNDTIYLLSNPSNGKDNKYSTFTRAGLYSGRLENFTKNNKAPNNLSGIAYDSVTHKFYLAGGSAMRVWSGSGKVQKKCTKKSVGITQDIGGHNGIIYVVRYLSANTNYIDMYRVSDCAYLGSYRLKLGTELESVSYYGEGNKIALYFYDQGTNTIWVTDKIVIS